MLCFLATRTYTAIQNFLATIDSLTIYVHLRATKTCYRREIVSLTTIKSLALILAINNEVKTYIWLQEPYTRIDKNFVV